MHGRNEPTEDVSLRQIVTTRVFDAPPERVFEAWSRPDLLARWWGPRGFTTTTHAFDFRVGGGWKHTMHGPDGTDYPNEIFYDEIVPPERIAYSHQGGVNDAVVHFKTTVTFVRQGERTEVTMRGVFPSAAVLEAVEKRYGAIQGAKDTIARLGELVEARVRSGAL